MILALSWRTRSCGVILFLLRFRWHTCMTSTVVPFQHIVDKLFVSRRYEWLARWTSVTVPRHFVESGQISDLRGNK